MFPSRTVCSLLLISLLSGTSLGLAPNKTHEFAKSLRADGITVTSKPDKIESGTNSVNVIYTLTPCDKTWNDHPADFGTTTSDLVAEGIAISTGSKFAIVGENCTLTLSVTISKYTPSKAYSFSVKAGGVEGAKAVDLTIVVVGPALPPRGPIPTASPEVDVMWAVMPHQVVSDNYGRMVASRYYGIEVVIGNNSGYDLQIAGVGFKFGPSGPYAELVDSVDKAIAMDHSKLAQSFNNKLKETIPYCESTTHPVRKEHNRSSAECVSMETRRILKELDDQLAASAEVARRVKASATQLSRQSAPHVNPSTSYQVARGTASRGQFWDFRNLLINGVKALGPILVGSHFFFGAAKELRWQQWTNLLTNPLPEGVAAVLPDERLLKLQRLDDQLLRDGKLISNNRQDRSRVLIPKKLLGLKTNDPILVTRALGELVIIGNQIQFINRVSVTSNPTGEIVPEPTVVDYDKEFLLGVEDSMTITGTNLAGAVILAPDKIEVKIESTTKNEVRALVKPDRTLDPKLYTLQLKAPGGLVPLAISLKQPLPSAPSDDPNTLLADGSFTEQKVKRGAKGESWTIRGRFLRGSKLTLLPSAQLPNVASADAPVVTSPTTTGNGVDDILVQVTVPNTAPAGRYIFKITPSQADNASASPTAPTVTLVVEDMTPEGEYPSVKNVTPGSTAEFDLIGKFLLPTPRISIDGDAKGFTNPKIKCSSDIKCVVFIDVPKDLKTSTEIKLKLERGGDPIPLLTKMMSVQFNPPAPTPTPTPPPDSGSVSTLLFK